MSQKDILTLNIKKEPYVSELRKRSSHLQDQKKVKSYKKNVR